MKRLLTALVIPALALGVSTAYADCTWDGAPDGGGSSANDDWSTVNNWVGDAQPSANCNVVIADQSPRSLCIYDVGATSSTFGTLVLGDSMTLRVSDSGLNFDAISLSGNATVQGTQDWSGTSLTIDAVSADASLTLTKSGTNKLDIGNTYNTAYARLIGGKPSATARDATLAVDAGTVEVDDLELYGGQGATFGVDGKAFVDVASGATLTINEDVYVTGDAEFETDVAVSADGLYVGSSGANNEAYLYKDGSGTLTVDVLIIRGSSSASSLLYVNAGNLSVP